MLAHIRPSLQWFTCEHRPLFNESFSPGSVSRTIQGPPRAQSPFARSRCYLDRRDLACIASEGVTPPSSLIRTHAPDQNPPTDFGLPIQLVFAGCCQPLLGDGPSRRYLCNPCMGAWTPTPGCLSGAFVRFFPESYSLTIVLRSSAHPIIHRNAISTMPKFTRRQSFLYVQAPMLARPPDGTHRADLRSCRRPGRLHHAMDWKLPSRTVVSLHDRIGQLSWRDFHPLDCSLVGCYLEPFWVHHWKWRSNATVIGSMNRYYDFIFVQLMEAVKIVIP